MSTMRPLSSTSCLCKDPATAVGTIVYVQTPWCHDIHSLFPVQPEEAGGTKDYEMSFLETFCFCSKLFFFSYVQLVLFFSLSSSSLLWEPFLPDVPHHLHPGSLVSLGIFFFFFGESSLVFIVRLALDLPVK